MDQKKFDPFDSEHCLYCRHGAPCPTHTYHRYLISGDDLEVMMYVFGANDVNGFIARGALEIRDTSPKIVAALWVTPQAIEYLKGANFKLEKLPDDKPGETQT